MISNDNEKNLVDEVVLGNLEMAATVIEDETILSTGILLASLHKIDRSLPAPLHREVNTTDANTYVDELIKETLSNPNKRAYKFKDNTSPIYGYVLDIYNQRSEDFIENLFNISCTNIAIRLLSAENRSVEKSPNMREPKKGSLIVTANSTGNEFLITISKIETIEILEDINLKLQSGIPFNKKSLKAAIIRIIPLDGTEFDIQVTVTDSGSTIAKYWTDDFLEVVELTSDEKNTKNAFNSIEKVLSLNLKKQAPSDYTELRNNLVGYFKTQPDFQYEEMINQVFGSYTMDNPEVSLEGIKTKVNDLVEKQRFDTHFPLVPSEIKARFKKTYRVSEEIELRTNGHIEGLRHIIKATTNSSGDKILEIKVQNDTIYKEFEFINEENDG